MTTPVLLLRVDDSEEPTYILFHCTTIAEAGEVSSRVLSLMQDISQRPTTRYVKARHRAHDFWAEVRSLTGYIDLLYKPEIPVEYQVRWVRELGLMTIYAN